MLVDAAHNPAGMRALRAALGDAFTFTKLVGLVAIFADKEPAEMLEILEPAIDHVVITRNTSPRSLPPRELGRIATEIFGEDRVTVEESMPDAIDAAVTLAEEDGMGGGVHRHRVGRHGRRRPAAPRRRRHLRSRSSGAELS